MLMRASMNSKGPFRLHKMKLLFFLKQRSVIKTENVDALSINNVCFYSIINHNLEVSKMKLHTPPDALKPSSEMRPQLSGTQSAAGLLVLETEETIFYYFLASGWSRIQSNISLMRLWKR